MSAANVTVKPCHDRKGVEILSPNDCLLLSIEEAITLKDRLSAAINRAIEEEPPAPGPLYLHGFNIAGTPFASCGEVKNGAAADSWYGDMGGFELNYGNLIQIKKWVRDVLEYIRLSGSVECRGCGMEYKDVKYMKECLNCGASL